MTWGKRNRSFTSLSSSSSSSSEVEEEEEDEEEDNDDDGDGDDHYHDDDDDDDYEEDTGGTSSSDDVSDWNEDEEADRGSDDDVSETVKPLDDEARCNRVINILKGGDDLHALKLEECKAYLRKHGLRLTGTKAVCVQRIREHWRFDKVTRSSNVIGRRTIAGRILKESYGEAKQQHTFTVEVLWSKGPKKLPPLFPLLVKGRNLYRLKTFRQPWSNEAERAKVLAEKHQRGTEARHVRAMKKSRSANGGPKHRRNSHYTRTPKEPQRQESFPTTTLQKQKHIDCRRKAPFLGPEKMKRVSKPRYSKSSSNLGSYNPAKDGVPMLHQYTHYPLRWAPPPHEDAFSRVHANREVHHCPSGYEVGSASTAMRVQPSRPYTNPTVAPTLHKQGYNQNYCYYNQYAQRNPFYRA
ncbi:PREDICTED: zinc finger CCCH domain-containing protein 62-like isoform X2 [Nelumbo nucifera]|uniref:Zinc finger CCCH domain-containing protein 62-like isoform X2 n=2 Tax=Nelumbo nucifera TaxID=4432 RepID=A0A1U8AYZ2_NELNU|nr:PREDICTED: zinc finger CCCH domain-containing protein 62-like isoform X2 [Nelumbo nucifera]DAD41195.1 TPA_asm: hypothetical protein HUJ06_015517 [Nelumbo nucifera]